jgi:hypothetical protein
MRGPEFDDVSSYNRTLTTVTRYPFEDADLKELERELRATDVSVENIPEFVETQIRTRDLSPIDVT